MDSSLPSTTSSKQVIPGQKFENTLILEKIKNEEDLYRFSFFGWRDSYDKYARQIIKFSGEMVGDHFVIKIAENKSFYSDDNLVENGEFKLYRDGEERCKVYFSFNEDAITVQTKDCNFIYGGFGVTFEGIYKKAN